MVIRLVIGGRSVRRMLRVKGVSILSISPAPRIPISIRTVKLWSIPRPEKRHNRHNNPRNNRRVRHSNPQNSNRVRHNNRHSNPPSNNRVRHNNRHRTPQRHVRRRIVRRVIRITPIARGCVKGMRTEPAPAAARRIRTARTPQVRVRGPVGIPKTRPRHRNPSHRHQATPIMVIPTTEMETATPIMTILITATGTITMSRPHPRNQR